MKYLFLPLFKFLFVTLYWIIVGFITWFYVFGFMLWNLHTPPCNHDKYKNICHYVDSWFTGPASKNDNNVRAVLGVMFAFILFIMYGLIAFILLCMV